MRRCLRLNQFGKVDTGAIEFPILALCRHQSKDIKSTGQREYDEQTCREQAVPDLALPKTRQQQRDDRRRRNPPVEEYFDIVPNPRRQLQYIWNDETKREGQVEKEEPARNDVIFALP